MLSQILSALAHLFGRVEKALLKECPDGAQVRLSVQSHRLIDLLDFVHIVEESVVGQQIELQGVVDLTACESQALCLG